VSKPHAVRLSEEASAELAAYAAKRGVKVGDLLRSAVEGFLEDSKRSVPDVERGQLYSRDTQCELEQGVGVCPKRAPGLGHVWAGVKASGDGTNPCKFCGMPGRQARDANGQPVGPEGYFERATRERVELFSRLRAPDSVKGVKSRDRK
jgi:hypothetical protein